MTSEAFPVNHGKLIFVDGTVGKIGLLNTEGGEGEFTRCGHGSVFIESRINLRSLVGAISGYLEGASWFGATGVFDINQIDFDLLTSLDLFG